MLTKGCALVIVEVIGDERRAEYLVALDRTADVGELSPAIARAVIARGRTGARELVVYDATAEDRFWVRLVDALRGARRYGGRDGTFVFDPYWNLETVPLGQTPIVRRMPAERVTGAVVANAIFVKLYRNVEAGTNPELELSRALQDAEFTHVPPLLGSITYAHGGETTPLGIAYRFVESRGTGWEIGLAFLRRRLERRRATPTPSTTGHLEGDGFGGFVRYAQIVGRRMAEFHQALASRADDPAFAPESYRAGDVRREIAAARALVASALDALGHSDPIAQMLRRRRREVIARVETLGRALLGMEQTRIHGNLSLDEILVVADDIVIIGLDGDTTLPLEQRRAKRSPLLDLSTMLASFDAAAEAVALHLSADRIGGYGPSPARRRRTGPGARVRRCSVGMKSVWNVPSRLKPSRSFGSSSRCARSRVSPMSGDRWLRDPRMSSPRSSTSPRADRGGSHLRPRVALGGRVSFSSLRSGGTTRRIAVRFGLARASSRDGVTR